MLIYFYGITIALGIIAIGKLIQFERERSFYPTVLIVIALAYVLLAVVEEEFTVALMEASIACVFIVISAYGFLRNLWWAVAGLIGHGVFDLLHGALISQQTAPAWWPGFCLAVDVVLGCYLAWLLARNRLPASPQQSLSSKSAL